jgi:hypothetical protein
MTTVEDLSNDSLFQIFSFMDLNDLLASYRTCQHWRYVCKDVDIIWKPHMNSAVSYDSNYSISHAPGSCYRDEVLSRLKDAAQLRDAKHTVRSTVSSQIRTSARILLASAIIIVFAAIFTSIVLPIGWDGTISPTAFSSTFLAGTLLVLITYLTNIVMLIHTYVLAYKEKKAVAIVIASQSHFRTKKKPDFFALADTTIATCAIIGWVPLFMLLELYRTSLVSPANRVSNHIVATPIYISCVFWLSMMVRPVMRTINFLMWKIQRFDDMNYMDVNVAGILHVFAVVINILLLIEIPMFASKLDGSITANWTILLIPTYLFMLILIGFGVVMQLLQQRSSFITQLVLQRVVLSTACSIGFFTLPLLTLVMAAVRMDESASYAYIYSFIPVYLWLFVLVTLASLSIVLLNKLLPNNIRLFS